MWIIAETYLKFIKVHHSLINTSIFAINLPREAVVNIFCSLFCTMSFHEGICHASYMKTITAQLPGKPGQCLALALPSVASVLPSNFWKLHVIQCHGRMPCLRVHTKILAKDALLICYGNITILRFAYSHRTVVEASCCIKHVLCFVSRALLYCMLTTKNVLKLNTIQ